MPNFSAAWSANDQSVSPYHSGTKAQIEAQAPMEEQGKFSYMIITELCLCCLGHSVSFACEVTNSVIVFTLEPCSNIYKCISTKACYWRMSLCKSHH